jgi:hypothetical protein
MHSIGCRQVYTYIIHAILRIFSWVVLCSSLCVTLVLPRWNLVGALFLCEDVCVVGRRQGGGTECAALYLRTVCLSGMRRGARSHLPWYRGGLFGEWSPREYGMFQTEKSV